MKRIDAGSACRLCIALLTAMLLCLTGCGQWDIFKDAASEQESGLYRQNNGSEVETGWTNFDEAVDSEPSGELNSDRNADSEQSAAGANVTTEGTADDKSLPAQDAESFYHAYSCLSGEERQLYLEILNSLLKYQEETELSIKDPDMVERVFQYVMADHPEIFYADGYEATTYRLGTELRRLTFTGTWTMAAEEVPARRTQLEETASVWLNGLPDGTDDYEKAKYIYDELIQRTEYEQGCADSQNICSVLLNQRSVCQGYAKTFQYLCQLAGIPSMLVTGEVNGEGHAWNLVFLDGDWYYTDPTWGDASYQRAEGAETTSLSETVNYDYFCVTTQDIERTHSIDDSQLLPVCSAVQDQYYRHEGLYLQSADLKTIDAVFAHAEQNGESMVRFQCADDAVYQEVYRLLIEEQGIFEYLPESETTAAYLNSDSERTFCFWVIAQ